VVRQGEIYGHVIAGSRYTVLVVSTDAHNEVRTPWVVPIRRGTMDAPPYLVALIDPDPLGGSADVDRLARISPGGTPIGIITGATMQRIREAIHTLYAG
jgi:mRNA-degrading endonuclease toxin of MazEF toxin-antitoxin module